MWVYSRRGTRTGSSTGSMFRLANPAGGGYDNSSKVIAGYSSGIDVEAGTGFRVTFPEAFTFRCVGLSICMVDAGAYPANWDYFTNVDPVTYPSSNGPAVFQHAGVFDRTGFQCYCRYNYLSDVSVPYGNNLIFSYMAWGV